MAQISLFLAKLEARLASLALGVVILSVLCGILSRILPLPTVTWSTELSGLAFTWAVFIGCALAFKRGLHVSIPGHGPTVTQCDLGAVCRFVILFVLRLCCVVVI